MRRVMVITVFAALVALPGFGQMRGGAHFGGAAVAHAGFTGHAGFAGHAPMAPRSAGFAPSVRGGVRFSTFGGFGGFRGTGFFPGRFHHHHHFFFGAGFYYPGYYWPYYYPYYDYSYPVASYTSPSYDYAGNSAYELEITQELDRLTAEVERLREEQEGRERASAPATPLKESRQEPARPTVLVFRDKHIQEAENYAIAGETLWLFNEQRARKVPLAELDLPATQKLNEERGIEFHVPQR